MLLISVADIFHCCRLPAGKYQDMTLKHATTDSMQIPRYHTETGQDRLSKIQKYDIEIGHDRLKNTKMWH